jgi:hypothetical protein
MKTFMPDLDEKSRLQLLRDNCDQHEETTYMRDLNQDEVTVRMEVLSKNLIAISKQDDILDEHKETYKSATKPLKTQNGLLLEEIKNRKTEVTGTLFHIADQEAGIMETFDDKGEFVSSRRLRPNEKQQKLFQLGKTAGE